jgi:uncharacterized protein YebE (UPF0316 family)
MRAVQEEGNAMALKISRTALLISFLLWGLSLILETLHVISPLVALGLGSHAGIAIGLSAAACVFFQGLSFKPKPRRPGNPE